MKASLVPFFLYLPLTTVTLQALPSRTPEPAFKPMDAALHGSEPASIPPEPGPNRLERTLQPLESGIHLPVRSSELPYSLRPGLDLPLIGGILAMKYHAGSLLGETRKVPLNLDAVDASSVPAFDRWAIGFHNPMLSAMSSGLAWSQFAIPLAVNAWDTYKGRQRWHGVLVDAVLLQEALMISTAMSSYAKSFPIHSTPLTYDPRVARSEKDIPQNVSSFFSNHTATAFTTAVFSAYTFQLRHPDSRLVPWLWGANLSMAAGVGSLRILAGKHFPSDVIAGAAVGALSGYLIPRMHLGKSRAAKAKEKHPLRYPRLEPEKPKFDVSLGVSFPGGSTTPVPTVSVDF